MTEDFVNQLSLADLRSYIGERLRNINNQISNNILLISKQNILVYAPNLLHQILILRTLDSLFPYKMTVTVITEEPFQQVEFDFEHSNIQFFTFQTYNLEMIGSFKVILLWNIKRVSGITEISKIVGVSKNKSVVMATVSSPLVFLKYYEQSSEKPYILPVPVILSQTNLTSLTAPLKPIFYQKFGALPEHFDLLKSLGNSDGSLLKGLFEPLLDISKHGNIYRSEKLESLKNLLIYYSGNSVVIYVGSARDSQTLNSILMCWNRSFGVDTRSIRIIYNPENLGKVDRADILLLFDFVLIDFISEVYVITTKEEWEMLLESISIDDRIEEIRNDVSRLQKIKEEVTNEKQRNKKAVNENQRNNKLKDLPDNITSHCLNGKVEYKDQHNNKLRTSINNTEMLQYLEEEIEAEDLKGSCSEEELSSEMRDKSLIESMNKGISKNKPYDVYVFKVFDPRAEYIKGLCGRKGCVRSVVRGDFKTTCISSYCTVGRIRTMINIHQDIKLPLLFPTTFRKSLDLFFKMGKLAVGVITSYDTFVSHKQITGQGFVYIHRRGLTIIKRSNGISLKVEVVGDDLESLLLLSLSKRYLKDETGPKRDFYCNLYIPLRHPPKVFILENEAVIDKMMKETTGAVDKIKILKSLVWSRASIGDIEYFNEGYDLAIEIKGMNMLRNSTAKNEDEGILKNKQSKNKEEELEIFTDKGTMAKISTSLRNFKVFVLFSTVNRVQPSITRNDMLKHFISEDFEKYYAILSLISRKYKYLANKLTYNDLEYLRVSDTVAMCKALDRTLRYRFDPVDIRIAPARLNLNVVKTAIVTPMGVEYGYEKMYETSRLFRNFDRNMFIKFSIRDSNGNKFNGDGVSDEDGVFEYFRKLMLSGLTVGPRRYFFLASTTSQLKEHNAWFVTPHDRNGVLVGADYIKSWAGAFSGIKNIGKYTVRIGQALSSTIDSCEIRNFLAVNDIERNNYCFTDGIGLISLKMAMQVSKILNLPYVPSAFQIRFAGYKGVVAVHPFLEDPHTVKGWCERNGLEYDDPNMYNILHNESLSLILRSSMNKFPSPHRMLEVVSTAKSTEFYLNRQIIIVLEGLGIPAQVFKDLQDRFVLDVLSSITNDLPSFISKYCFIFPRGVISSDFKMFRKMIIPTISRVFEDLSKKSKLYVPEGRSAMGVSDELGILEHNEVFLMFMAPKETYSHSPQLVRYGQYVVPVGQAIIAKNPCVHPGDLRVVVCVDRPELHYLRDVIVFSQKGDRPLYNQCSGSDLDGDQFNLSWRSSLIPSVIFKPYNYVNVSALTKETVLHSDMINFYVRYLKTNQLGLIAHAFLAISDKYSIFSPQALRLSELFNRNIDFIKTGNFASLPDDLVPTEYPDYMEKLPSYVSMGVIGQMYRRARVCNIFTSCECQKCTEANFKKLTYWQQRVLMGAPVVVRDEYYECDKEESSADGSGSKLFNGYKEAITNILINHKIKSEELLLFHCDVPESPREVVNLIRKYTKHLKEVNTSEIAKKCLGCYENVNSLVWLGESGFKMKCRKYNFNSKGIGNCVFNDRMILLGQNEEVMRNVPSEYIVLSVDMKKYFELAESLNDKRLSIFKEAFNLIYITGKYVFDDIMSILSKINVSMRSDTRIEFARSIFLLSDDLLFHIGFLLVLDFSIVTKVLILKQEKKEANGFQEPTKIFKRLCLIISGMLDDSEDIGFEKTRAVSGMKEAYIPVLRNRGSCNVDYYKDTVRDFIVNIIFSNGLRQYCEESRASRISTSATLTESHVRYELSFVPGRFYIAELDPSLKYDSMSVRELMLLMDRNDPQVTVWFVALHRCLDENLRRDSLKEMKKMVSERPYLIFSFSFKETKYELKYVDSVLVSVISGRRRLGKAYIVNSCELGIKEESEKGNDLMVDLSRYDVLYTTEYSMLGEDETFMLEGSLFELRNDRCYISDTLACCSSFKLEIITSFKNADNFFLRHRVTYNGNSKELTKNGSTLRCSARSSWPSDSTNFDKIFSKLWKVYGDVLYK
ncbi:RNA-dependent RNA polymerase [Pancytospora epiphaga]|nr:RNA-dependent RNA polymerase [Pancytospora epiphaga]